MIISSVRAWWRNCALKTDPEIQNIDKIEDQISPLDPIFSRIRGLISSLELCHHKADKWVFNIIEAIGSGETKKGMGIRPADQLHLQEKVWQNVCAALSAWCAGSLSTTIDLPIGEKPASHFLASLGERSQLKEWQVHRVIDKIRSSIHWPRSNIDPTAQYIWLLLSGGEHELAYLNQCPEFYKEHENFWLATVLTIINDTQDGNKAELSLGLAIDMLWPCHWKFMDNLQIVLEAIGGKLHSDKPYAACGRNVWLLPIRDQMNLVSITLRYFYDNGKKDKNPDPDILAKLGELTEVKKWLAASLDKTIRLQMEPPPELKEISSLDGPAWIKK